jgi:hypothetical protein
MKRDEVWRKIKDDNSKIYGQSMIDVFLKTTTRLNPEHLKEVLNMGGDHFESISGAAIREALEKTPEQEKQDLIEEIIKKRKNFDEELAFSILWHSSKNKIEENAKKLGQANIDKINSVYVSSLVSKTLHDKATFDQIKNILGEKIKDIKP